MRLTPNQVILYKDFQKTIINKLKLKKEEVNEYGSIFIREIKNKYPNISFDECLILAKTRFIQKHSSFIIEI